MKEIRKKHFSPLQFLSEKTTHEKFHIEYTTSKSIAKEWRLIFSLLLGFNMNCSNHPPYAHDDLTFWLLS